MARTSLTMIQNTLINPGANQTRTQEITLCPSVSVQLVVQGQPIWPG